MKENLKYERVGEGAFINTSTEDLKSYQMARERATREKQLQERVDSLEAEVRQIKQILLKHIVG